MSTPLTPLSASERDWLAKTLAGTPSPAATIGLRLLAERDSLERERDEARDHLEQAARRELALTEQLAERERMVTALLSGCAEGREQVRSLTVERDHWKSEALKVANGGGA